MGQAKACPFRFLASLGIKSGNPPPAPFKGEGGRWLLNRRLGQSSPALNESFSFLGEKR
jgi:hypothetical protein